jgi:hypothetical protein
VLTTKRVERLTTDVKKELGDVKTELKSAIGTNNEAEITRLRGDKERLETRMNQLGAEKLILMFVLDHLLLYR